MTLHDLAVGYGRRQVLEGVSMELRQGTVTALVGTNGSGKTTLLRAILGLQPLRRGSLAFPSGQRPRVGYVPQADLSEVLFPVTAAEVVAMGLVARRPRLRGHDAAAAVNGAMQRFGVADLASSRFADLSGGQRQRVLLSRALVVEPRLLVLDEPVRGLDFASAATLVSLISSLAHEGGLAVVVATHSLDLVANHADQVALFKEGRCEVGPADEQFTDEALTRFHGRPMRVREVEGQRVVLAPPDPPRDAHVPSPGARERPS